VLVVDVMQWLKCMHLEGAVQRGAKSGGYVFRRAAASVSPSDQLGDRSGGGL